MTFVVFCIDSKLDTVKSFFSSETCPCISGWIEVVSALGIVEGGEVAVYVGYSVEGPTDTVAVIIKECGLVAYLTVMSSITIYGSVLSGYFPVIVLWTISLTYDLAEVAFYHRIESFVGFTLLTSVLTVLAVIELAAGKEITLAFFLTIETWYSPAGLYIDALYW